MCLDPDVFPPLAGFRLYAILGVFHHVLFLPSVCIDLFITPYQFYFEFAVVGLVLTYKSQFIYCSFQLVN